MAEGIVAAAAALLSRLSKTQLGRLVKAKGMQLRRERLAAEVHRLSALLKRKASELGKVERKFKGMLGFRDGTKPGRRRRASGETLVGAVEKVLGRAAKPLKLTELTKAVRAAGYRTKSDLRNFRTSVAHTLRKMKDRLVRKAGGYLLKAAKAAKAAAQGSSSTSQ
ncbi:MAG: hypothetical protein HYY17_13540 [Planctomycetes bacterium]|nr:hypothetical protein [Planctomycetota bacterium]